LWAAINAVLGTAFLSLEVFDQKPKYLDQAVAALNSALLEARRSDAPLQWAGTQAILADIYTRLGERDSDTASLEEAVDRYHAALDEITSETAAFLHAKLQANLGNALVKIAERELGQSPFDGLITRIDPSTESLRIEQDLSSAVERLEGHEKGYKRLLEAVTALRIALSLLPRAEAPKIWAGIQNILCTALVRLGEQEETIGYLEEALAAVDLALEVLDYSRFPTNWALASMNRGLIFLRIGERSIGKERIRILEQAAISLRAPVENQIFTTESVTPFYWAQLNLNLGATLFNLAKSESQDLRNIEQAISASRSALSGFTVIGAHRHSSMAQRNLENALALRESQLQEL
jgi:tetratricopeptide (TPR) repeat protein